MKNFVQNKSTYENRLPSLTWVTFSDAKYDKTKTRIVLEAKQFSIFSNSFVWGESELHQYGFMTLYKDFVDNNKRGFGYWIWKPWIINFLLQHKIKKNSYLLYLDVGCSFNANGQARALKYIDFMEAHNKSFMAFQMEHLEKKWTKGEIFDFFGSRNLGDTGQFHASVILFKNNEISRSLVSRWLSLMVNQQHFFTDIPSTTPNFPDFVDNRHDQSVFSMCIKAEYFNDVFVLQDETWASDWSTLKDIPYWTTRFKF